MALQKLLEEQAKELTEAEHRLERYREGLHHSKIALPELSPLERAEDERAKLVAKTQEDLQAMLHALDPEGETKLADLKLKPEDLQRAILGIRRDCRYGQSIAFCLERFGSVLQNADFLDHITAALSRFASLAFDELEREMKKLRRTYHTESHSIEMVLDCSAQIKVVGPHGTPAHARTAASKILLLVLALYHDIIQDKGPFENERLSVERLLTDFEATFKPILLPLTRAEKALHSEACFSEAHYAEFLRGLRHLADLVINSATYLVNFGPSLRMVEHRVKDILQKHVSWIRPEVRDLRNDYFGTGVPWEAERMAAVISHFDILRYSDADIAARATKDLRLALDLLASEGTLSSPPLDRSLLDIPYTTGFHVLAGQSLRMLGELAASFTSDAPAGRSYFELFYHVRELLSLPTQNEQELRDIVSQRMTLVKRTAAGPITFKGALTNIMLHHLKGDLGFVARRDEMESEHVLVAAVGGEPDTVTSIGSTMRGAGGALLTAFGQFYDRCSIVETREDDFVFLEDVAGLSTPQLRAKECCGIALLYLATRQEGFRATPSSVWQRVRDIAEEIRTA
eukprot:TRINITY_DN6142_c0_g1_i1.p2 TRINITY_DN6142_c0_g1~~TRINITY_DN6142_c0_g1_i1.p2  ORF type:complete len:572 (-),score=87.98 TRINITY_DN6142_c0_g1_i1:16-1731(-)